MKTLLVLVMLTLSFQFAQAEELSELEQNTLIIQSQITEMNAMQEALADVEDTHGLMSALGQTISQATLSLQHIQKTSDLKESRETVQELSVLITDFKGMDPLNRILGLHVNSELSF